MFFQAKYKKKYDNEVRREAILQNHMNKNGWSREKAVHQYDYDQEMNKHFKGSKFYILIYSY